LTFGAFGAHSVFLSEGLLGQGEPTLRHVEAFGSMAFESIARIPDWRIKDLANRLYCRIGPV
jgi:hypothetical protein